MPRYNWASPAEWLDDVIDGLGRGTYRGNEVGADEIRTQLVMLARDLASKLDNDTIQDLLQSEMDADGFFEDLDAKKEDDADEEKGCE